MKELRPDATFSDGKTEPAARASAPSSSDASGPAHAEPSAPNGDAAAFFVASHDALFVETPANRCDACGDTLAAANDDAFDERLSYGIPGRGVYLWTRGDETRLETVPLCPSCASAIGMTALARWEIEEEEG